MDKNYCVIVRTADAEFRALRHLDSTVLTKFLPVIELTRGRAKKNSENVEIHPYDKKVEHIVEIFKGQQIALDVTSDKSLTSNEIDELFNYRNGYENWINLLLKLMDTNAFSSIIPSVLLNYEDGQLDENVRLQVSAMSKYFDSIMYRYSIENEGGIEDLRLISGSLPSNKELIVVIDCEFVPEASYHNVAYAAVERIKGIKEVLSNRKYQIVLASTTYPNNVLDIGNETTDTFDLKEIDLFETVFTKYNDIIYGDYGSINPKRNDQIVMAHGWVPKIDVALPRYIYYYRRKRPKGVSAYVNTYTNVAKMVVADGRFPFKRTDIWGINQIINCSNGAVPSSSPSFWISVRMNTHISQQVKRLNS